MDAQKRQKYLKAMGVQTWEPRVKKTKKTAKVTIAKAVDLITDDRASAIAHMTWQELEATVASCTACPLYKTRTNPVFGVGNRQADLLIVGEAPGSNEDKQGEPFVGRAGKLLNSMLQAIGLERNEIYIANVLKSRPPNNRDPSSEEVAACTPFLQRQIALLQPKLMLAVGRVAAHYLLGTDEAMANLRGKEFHYGPLKTPLIITYHPAYLLRAPREKRKAWDDLVRVREKLKK
jgi:uracil-DNA glycosylase family 4